MTSIRVGNHVGYADYGKKSRQEMIESYRRIAERKKLEAEEILLAADSDFIVEQYRGLRVRRDLKLIDA